MANNLFVGGLPYETTQEELAEMFRAHGAVKTVKLIMDRDTGRSKGFGFVEMATDEEAAAAAKAMNGYLVGGRKLFVNEAKPQETRPAAGPAYTGPERRSGRDRRQTPAFGARSSAPAPRAFGEGKPWEKKPWQKKEGGFGDKKPWVKKEGGFGDKKPWAKKEGGFGPKKFGDKKPWEKKEGGFGPKKFGDKKPWEKKEGGFGEKKFGDKKPWEKKPWDKKPGPGGDFPKKKWGAGGPSGGKKPGNFARKPGFGGGKPGRRNPD